MAEKESKFFDVNNGSAFDGFHPVFSIPTVHANPVKADQGRE